jgi:hypothetical protein
MTTRMPQMPARRVRGMLAAVCLGAIGVAGLMSLPPKAHAASCPEPAGVGRVGQAFVDDLKSPLGPAGVERRTPVSSSQLTIGITSSTGIITR